MRMCITTITRHDTTMITRMTTTMPRIISAHTMPTITSTVAACSGHHGHDHDDHASAWGHAHAPEPQELAGPGGWKRGLSAIVAVGLRPCSGAILVLVFALAQGLFWAGVAATFIMGLGTAITVAAIAALAVGARGIAQRFADARPGPGMLLLRGMEVAAALLVLVFGVALLIGYIASERMFALKRVWSIGNRFFVRTLISGFSDHPHLQMLVRKLNRSRASADMTCRDTRMRP